MLSLSWSCAVLSLRAMPRLSSLSAALCLGLSLFRRDCQLCCALCRAVSIMIVVRAVPVKCTVLDKTSAATWALKSLCGSWNVRDLEY